MRAVDLDKKFKEYIAALVEKTGADKKKLEALEDTIPELYFAWLDERKDYLGGRSPNEYFAGMDSTALHAHFKEYVEGDMPFPEPFMDALVAKGKETEDFLSAAIAGAGSDYTDPEAAKAARISAIEILTEMQSTAHKQTCLDIIAGMSADNTTEAERAAEALMAMGPEECGEALFALQSRSGNIHCVRCCLDILTDFGRDERVYKRLSELFLTDTEALDFYAFCLGRYGDERALPLLIHAMNADDISYYEYNAIRNAAEELGADGLPERAFDGDEDYEKMKRDEKGP